MPSWQFVAEPRACRRLAWLVGAVHGLAALVPWAAGCQAWLAAVLSLACLAALRWTLAGLPGPRCRVQGLERLPAGWCARLRAGGWVPVEVTAATRVLPGLVVCGLRVGGRWYEWWVPRAALPADAFRRLKVALRTDAPGGLARIDP